jgi:hypothetical protein
MAVAVQQLAHHVSAPAMRHWVAAKRVLRYLAGTINTGLTYGRNATPDAEITTADISAQQHPSYTPSLVVQGFVDANWGANLDTRRATTGYVFMLSGAAISWASKLQQTVALSSTEAEYMALSAATQDALFLRQLLPIFRACLYPHLKCAELPPIQLWEDNQGSIHMAQNQVTSSRSKHIDIRHHFVREQCNELHSIVISYIPTQHQLADCLTKNLGRIQFRLLSNIMLGAARISPAIATPRG